MLWWLHVWLEIFFESDQLQVSKYLSLTGSIGNQHEIRNCYRWN